MTGSSSGRVRLLANLKRALTWDVQLNYSDACIHV